MKTGPSKLFRKLALNRRSNRINHTVYGGMPSNEIPEVKNPFKARTITLENRREMATYTSIQSWVTRHTNTVRGLEGLI